MSTPALIERVRELHSAVSETQPSLPEQKREELSDLRKQLEVVMLQPDNTEQFSSLRDRLLVAYIAFQSDNPRVAGAMQGVIAELAAAGI